MRTDIWRTKVDKRGCYHINRYGNGYGSQGDIIDLPGPFNRSVNRRLNEFSDFRTCTSKYLAIEHNTDSFVNIRTQIKEGKREAQELFRETEVRYGDFFRHIEPSHTHKIFCGTKSLTKSVKDTSLLSALKGEINCNKNTSYWWITSSRQGEKIINRERSIKTILSSLSTGRLVISVHALLYGSPNHTFAPNMPMLTLIIKTEPNKEGSKRILWTVDMLESYYDCVEWIDHSFKNNQFYTEGVPEAALSNKERYKEIIGV